MMQTDQSQTLNKPVAPNKQSPFPFLELPPEIRSIIYDAIYDNHCVELVPLTAVNKALRNEVSPVLLKKDFYITVHFEISIADATARKFNQTVETSLETEDKLWSYRVKPANLPQHFYARVPIMVFNVEDIDGFKLWQFEIFFHKDKKQMMRFEHSTGGLFDCYSMHLKFAVRSELNMWCNRYCTGEMLEVVVYHVKHFQRMLELGHLRCMTWDCLLLGFVKYRLEEGTFVVRLQHRYIKALLLRLNIGTYESSVATHQW